MKASLTLLTLLFGIAAVFAAETAFDLQKMKKGTLAPEFRDGALVFTSTADNAAAAAYDAGKFDFRQGAKIELEFAADVRQSNRFPRLMELGSLSIHMECDPAVTSPNKMMKVLLNGNDSRFYAQARVAVMRADEWRKLTVTIDPAAKCFTLTVAGVSLDPAAEPVASEESLTATYDFETNLNNLSAILGAAKLEKSNRGFNGKIRNVKITTPYQSNAADLGKLKAAMAPPVVNNVPVRHFIISHIKNRHHAFPGVCRMPNGDLAVTFREGEAHVCPYGRICVVYSKDNGKNWSAPVAVADTPTDERDPSIQTLSDGRVLLTHGGWNSWLGYKMNDQFPGESNYILQAGEKNFGGSHYLFSTDNGKTWGAPIKVPAFAPHGPAFVDGFFYQPSLGNDNGKRQVYMYRGRADATQWERIGTVGESNDVAMVPYEEPHTVALSDGTLVTAIRVPTDGYMRISFSKDKGVTWTEPVKTAVRGFPFHLLLLKDGRLLATYGYRYPPMGVRACISKDGGKTWDLDNEMIVQNNGLHIDLGYPVSIETENGEVLTVYYHVTKERPDCYIEGAVYKP